MINFSFFGSDEFSLGVLNKLTGRGLIPGLIITTPDRPKGRNLLVSPTLVKIWAQENGINCLSPEKLLDENFLAQLKVANLKLFVVASYGKIIPKEVLSIPACGALNVHPSLLPKYRGPTPIETAILNGDQETGVTIMLVDEQMDHGPIVRSKKLAIESDIYYQELRDQLAALGGQLLAEVLPQWVRKEIEAKEQKHDQATYTKKIKKEDGLIDLTADPELNYRKIRAFTPWPGTYFFRRGQRIIIKRAHLEDNRLILERVVPEGRREMSWVDFIRNQDGEASF